MTCHFDHRDDQDPQPPKIHCNFHQCRIHHSSPRMMTPYFPLLLPPLNMEPQQQTRGLKQCPFGRKTYRISHLSLISGSNAGG
ncbi:hypothetical protein AALO_G00306730 [Alosa alosa]|uniref:Uncharacterized protein n=1 Tax=Alosa alosa TaxID=278164 RepID=A0AAV6FFW2_9TELE|nr:hypothetical protein AALO_G00306730 [Alosa alosa]